jgi:integrase/recombinase XerD
MATDHTLQDINDKLDELQNLEYISDQNYQLIEEFSQHLKADSDITNDRIFKYLYMYKTLFKKFIDFPLDEAEKKDIRLAVGELESSEYSDWSKKDFKTAIRKFYKVYYESEVDRPKRIKRILNSSFMKSPRSVENQRNIEPLEPDEVLKMCRLADNPRNSLIPMFFFESGARINEILGVKLSDIEMNEKYAEVTFHTSKNDKGDRTLVMTRCVDLLRKWIEYHPQNHKDNAYLFVNLGGARGSKKGDQMTDKNTNKILKRLASKAGIEKRITNHIMRHSSASYFGLHYSVARLKYRMGWNKFETAKAYVHENEQKMKAARLEEEGIEEEKQEDPTERKKCSTCGDTWSFSRQYCGKCCTELEEGEEPVETGERTKEELQEKVENLERKVSQLA